MDIRDKVVIITGASSGIGLAAARHLTNLGAKVALVSRSREKLVDISHEIKDSFVAAADLTNENDIKTMVQEVLNHYGRIDVLVNNAGQGYDALVENIDIRTLEHVMSLDLVGPIIAMQQVIPIMKKQGGGAIVNISSGTALMHLSNMGGYAATKAALAHLSLTAREELKKYNINVSVVYPYITLTNFDKNTIKNKTSTDNLHRSSDAFEPPHADLPEHVALQIADCIESGRAEVFAHDWMSHIGNDK